MDWDETRGQDGRILCLTLTEVFNSSAPKFLLACYTATTRAMRSLGIGTLHRRRLTELLQGEYSDYLGLFSEIESTEEPGLDPQTLHTRQQRLNFFLRLGVKVLPIPYRFPSYVKGEAPIPGQLLWVPFGDGKLAADVLAQVLRRIYVQGYGLAPADPLIEETLAHLPPEGVAAAVAFPGGATMTQRGL
jgi:hypothetical protein